MLLPLTLRPWGTPCCLRPVQAQKDAAKAKAELQAQLTAAAGERDRLQQRSTQLESEVSAGVWDAPPPAAHAP